MDKKLFRVTRSRNYPHLNNKTFEAHLVTDKEVVLRIVDNIGDGINSYQEYVLGLDEVSDDCRANFEVVTDLLWIADQYRRAYSGEPTAPDILSLENARDRLNLAIKDVQERMVDDGFGVFSF